MMFRDVPLHANWIKDEGLQASDAPRSPSLHTQKFWPEHAVRMGQSMNTCNRLREVLARANAMHRGTARDSQFRRTSGPRERVKATGR